MAMRFLPPPDVTTSIHNVLVVVAVAPVSRCAARFQPDVDFWVPHFCSLFLYHSFKVAKPTENVQLPDL